MFTNREKQVIEFLICGKHNYEIANELNISIHTVKAHIENIYSKLGVHSRVALITKLFECDTTGASKLCDKFF